MEIHIYTPIIKERNEIFFEATYIRLSKELKELFEEYGNDILNLNYSEMLENLFQEKEYINKINELLINRKELIVFDVDSKKWGEIFEKYEVEREIFPEYVEVGKEIGYIIQKTGKAMAILQYLEKEREDEFVEYNLFNTLSAKIEDTEDSENNGKNFRDLLIEYGEKLTIIEDWDNVGTNTERFWIEYIILDNKFLKNETIKEKKDKLKVFEYKKKTNKFKCLENIEDIITEGFESIEFISLKSRMFFIKEDGKYRFVSPKKKIERYYSNYRRIENFIFGQVLGRNEVRICDFSGVEKYKIENAKLEDLKGEIFENVVDLSEKDSKNKYVSILVRKDRIIKINIEKKVEDDDKKVAYIITKEIKDGGNKIYKIYTNLGELIIDQDIEIINTRNIKCNCYNDIKEISLKIKLKERESKRKTGYKDKVIEIIEIAVIYDEKTGITFAEILKEDKKQIEYSYVGIDEGKLMKWRKFKNEEKIYFLGNEKFSYNIEKLRNGAIKILENDILKLKEKKKEELIDNLYRKINDLNNLPIEIKKLEILDDYRKFHK